MVRKVLLATLVAGTTVYVSAQEPALPDLLIKAADYAATYRPKVSGVTLEEQLILIEMAATRMTTPVRLASDLVLLDTANGLAGFRDVFAIDTRATREHTPRIVNALKDPTQARWQQAQAMVQEGAHLFRANVVLWYSDPMLALQFIERHNHERLTFKLEGRKRINNVQVYGVGFKENQEEKKTYILDTPANPHSSGRIWVDPATGAIHQTELWVESKTDTARIQVTYAPDKTLGVLLPREAGHTFDWRELGSGTANMGSGGAGRRQSFECTAKYSTVSYTPIDLRKIAR